MGRLSLIGLCCFLACINAQAEDHNIAYKLLQNKEILSLEKILQINQKSMPGKVLEVELERENKVFIYEIEVLNDKGLVWEFKINAKTGQIIKKELD